MCNVKRLFFPETVRVFMFIGGPPICHNSCVWTHTIKLRAAIYHGHNSSCLSLHKQRKEQMYRTQMFQLSFVCGLGEFQVFRFILALSIWELKTTAGLQLH